MTSKRPIFSQTFRIILPANDVKDFKDQVEKIFFADFRKEKEKRSLRGEIQEGMVFAETEKRLYI